MGNQTRETIEVGNLITAYERGIFRVLRLIPSFIIFPIVSPQIEMQLIFTDYGHPVLGGLVCSCGIDYCNKLEPDLEAFYLAKLHGNH